jgi:DNA-binding CsgD family transcriptional regulator
MTHQLCHDLIELLSKAKTVEDIHSVCETFSAQFGFDHFIYGSQLPTSFVNPYYLIISGYPVEWRARYTAENYQQIDPTVTHCFSQITPIAWEQIKSQEKRDRVIRRFMGEAREFRLRSGISFPIHASSGEMAMLSLASERNYAKARADILQVMPYAHYFTSYAHEAARKVCEQQVLSLKRAQLTEKERQCLLWAAEGKTSWEISVILRLSERTVRFHIHNASEKLNVVSRQHAVARAVSLGLINPHLG